MSVSLRPAWSKGVLEQTRLHREPLSYKETNIQSTMNYYYKLKQVWLRQAVVAQGFDPSTWRFII